MFIHGPFETNICIDKVEIQKLKTVITQEILSQRQFCILKSLDGENKTKDEIMNELKEKNFALSDADIILNTLKDLGFIEKLSKDRIKSHMQEAIECFDRAIRLDHDFADAWLNMGYGFDCSKRHNEAAKSFEMA